MLFIFDNAYDTAIFFFTVLLWSPYVIGHTIIFLPCDFYLLSFFSPNLSGHRLDVYHTSSHGVAIYNAGLKRAARGSLEMQELQNRAISSQRRHV